MKIHHIISAGLERGKYYKVYVTQVNKNDVESPRSIPSLIRVGDVEAPPVPVLSVNTSEFSNGCYADGESITTALTWTESVCDDLGSYVLYRWSTLEGYTADGEYSKNIASSASMQYTMTSGTTSTEITGLTAGTYVYFGIQAIDLSRNASNIYVIKVDAEDLTQLSKPTSPITVETYGIWALRVSTPCPQFSNIRYVVFYRDGWKQLPAVVFHKGLTAEYVDTLDVVDGLTHFYTYLYITKDGRKSPMSDPSKSVTAKPIDTSYIDSTVVEDLKKAWQTDDIASTAALLKAASKQAQQVQELYKQLKDVTESYNALYDKYTVAANEIKLLSARVDTAEGTLTAYGTAIEQNATNITLRATKGDIDAATGQLRSGLVSMLNVQADRISTVVADTSKNASAITQLSNQMQLKVNSGDLSSQINLAIQNGISVAYIKANRIVLDGQMLLEGNARINGKLYSNDIALIDSATNAVIWGAGSGTINPVVTDMTINTWHYSSIFNTSNSWVRGAAGFYFTPKAPVNFNGWCTAKVTYKVGVWLEFGGADPQVYLCIRPSSDSEYEAKSGCTQILTYPVNHGDTHGWQLIPVTNPGTVDGHTTGKGGDTAYYQEFTMQYTGQVRIGSQVSMDLCIKTNLPVWGTYDFGYEPIREEERYGQVFVQALSAHIEVI